MWIAVPVLLAVGIAAGLTVNAEPAYRSSMVLFVTTGAGDPDSKASRLNSYIALLTGPRVAESVVTTLGPPVTAAEVQESLSAQVQEGTDLLVISATHASQERSRSIVTTATSVLISLAEQLDPPNPEGDGPSPSVSIAQNPVTTRESDNLVRNISFSAVLGLLIGAVAVAVREATRKTVTEEDDLRRLGLGTLGVIALGGRVGRSDYPGEALAEAFRRLRSLLPDVLGRRGDGARGTSLLLTGCNPQEGTTAVACGLAIAIAETGAKVVLVDANLRTPGVARYLALDTSLGLADVLAGTAGVPDVLRDSLDGRLTVLPSGGHAPDPGEILASPNLGATVRDLTERFDVVLVDAPPLLGVADAAVLSKVTDIALLVVRANRTRTVEVERSMDLLQRVGARLAGAVLNALPRQLPNGATWHHKSLTPAPSDTQLIADLLGDHGAHAHSTETRAADDTIVFAPTGSTVRGRARVLKATIATSNGDAAHDSPADPAGAVRGQARVVVTDAQAGADAPREPSAAGQPSTPGTSSVPTQRGSVEGQLSGE
jgi:capsular exopolysaccharide synthesis family protein